MQARKIRWAALSVSALLIATGNIGCGRAGISAPGAKKNSRPVLSAFLEGELSGDWLEVACNEGDTGPELPPPPYVKGVIRFRDHAMHWSSRIYDDKDCKVLRPNPSVESVVPYILATDVKTLDGSTALDLQVPNTDSGGSVTMYGLLKVHEGKLYMSLYPEPGARPNALDPRHAQIFAPL